MKFHHKQVEIVPFKKELIYQITADVEKYPIFIPWISKIKLLNSYSNIKEYELSVDFKLIKEKFSTKDIFYENEKIEIFLIEGPFKFLENTWYFKEIDKNTTEVIFEIEFEFKSKILSALFSKLFIEVQKKILKTFIKRARDISGN